MPFQGKSDYRHDSIPHTGLLLVNLGTPSAPTASAIRSYLREFLSDRRVIEIPRLLWLPILHLFVLPLRPKHLVRAYKKIWLEDGAPLLVYTRKQAEALTQRLYQNGMDKIIVQTAMCYGDPSISEGIKVLKENNIRQLLILPLYPQYSATTTGAVFDIVTQTLRDYRWLPEVRFINQYYDHSQYIHACAEQIRRYRDHANSKRKLLFSFHGLPHRNLLAGDPYHCHCHATARLIADALSLQRDDWIISFQSRFGYAEWLKPYTDETLKALPGKGVTEIDIFCPGFAADCLETLEEIAVQNHGFFMAAGGEDFNYIPALNDSQPHIEFLAQLVRQHLSGWNINPNNASERRKIRERALTCHGR